MARSNTFHEALVRAPMLRLVLPFIAGLLIARQFDLMDLWPGVLAIALALAWFILSGRVHVYRLRWWRGALLYPALVFFGMGWQVLRSPERTDTLAHQRSATAAWGVRIMEVISAGPSTMRMWAGVNVALDSAGAHPARGGLLLTLVLDSAASHPGVGDRLLVHARLDTIDQVSAPGGFDGSAWAASYGVRHRCFAGQDQWRTVRTATGFASFFEGARRRISHWLEHAQLDARERGMVKAILLGIRDELDADQKTAFARSGTMHVLAVSGSHVALIYAALLWLFKRFGEKRGWRVIRSLLILLVLWSYAGITGATPSVLRATVTFTLFCLADMAGRTSGPVNSLAAAAFLLLLWDPLMVGQLSFQLSFLAVAGIALFYRPLMNLWAAPNKVLHYCWSLIAVSIAAQLMTTPLALLSFGAFPVWFLPANIVVVSLVALGVYGGAALLVLQWVPVVNDLCTGVMVALLKLLGWTTDLFAWMPGAYPSVRINTWQCVGMYAFILLGAAAIFEGWRWVRIGLPVLGVLLLASWGWEAQQRNTKQRFVVYDDRDQLICAVESGRLLTVLADSLDPWAARKVDAHRRAIGALDVDTVAIPDQLTMAHLRVQWLHGGQKAVHRVPSADLLIVSDDAWYDPDSLIHGAAPTEGIVLAPSVGWKRGAFWRHWGEMQGVPVHDVKQQGAYVR